VVDGGRMRLGSVETVDVRFLIFGKAPLFSGSGVIVKMRGVVTVVVALVSVVEAVFRASGARGEGITGVGT
jgi:hypothetical protein